MQTMELIEFYGKSTLKVYVKIQNKNQITTQISGDLSVIDFPEISLFSTRKNELWTVGCFEIFISKDDKSYTEHNFGFCTNWECFEFDDYRKNQSRPKIIPPEINCKTSKNKFTQNVKFHEDTILDNSFSVTAVIKLKNGDLLYFANKHCGQIPDFHLKDARNLKLNSL